MSFSYKILILDDDILVTSSLKSLFLLEGFTNVVFFNSPLLAIEYLKNNICDVIISDFIMPDLNGLEFLRQAKLFSPNASMILLTGYADKENAIKAINDVGLYKYIEKPWDNDELIINVKNACERSRLISDLQLKNKQLQHYSAHLQELVDEKTLELSHLNEQLSAIINNCADAIIVLSQSGNVIDVNPASESLFGLSDDILKSKNIKDLFISDDVVFSDVLSSSSELLLRNIDVINLINGSKIPVEISSAFIPPNSSSDSPKFVFVVRNVHVQKEMERLRDDFIATLTHDLRTPCLAAIQTLEYFLNGKLGVLSEKQSLLLSTMKNSNEDMLGLINTLLEVYKYEAGRLKLVKSNFLFESLIDECIAQISPIADSKNISIIKNINNISNSPVFADRNELRRVIVNLLGNAVKFTQNSGKIEVKAFIDNADLHFSVKDNGVGISKQDIPKLFKRFSQGTNDKRSISTGLGLYLSKQIIDAHGGKIWIESDKGVGSEFFCLLLDSVILNDEVTL